MKYVKPISLFNELLKGNTSKQGQLLGLDVGSKYVGVAASDDRNIIASPISVLLRKKSSMDTMGKDFQDLISQIPVEGFVIGCCYNRQRCSIDSAQVKLFVEDLQKTGRLEGMKYTYWDERFSSKCVEGFLKPLRLQPAMYKTIVDKFAAVGILQEYLDSMNRNLRLDNPSQ